MIGNERGDGGRNDPYRGRDGDVVYRRSSRLARLAVHAMRLFWVVIALVWALAVGAFVDEVPPLHAALVVYVLGVALLALPVAARARIRRSRALAAEPRLEPPSPWDLESLHVSLWRHALLLITGGLLAIVAVSGRGW